MLFLRQLLFLVLAAALYAQPNTVTTRPLVFPKGKPTVERSGRANYAHSYVWVFRGEKDRNVEIRVTSPDGRVQFSLTSDKTGTVKGAFLRNEWTGTLPGTGQYHIVLVMNDDSARAVPYKLRVTLH